MSDKKHSNMSFEKSFTKEEAAAYIQHTLQDGTIKPIHITWNFDEAQADPFHHSWTGKHFLEAVKILVEVNI